MGFWYKKPEGEERKKGFFFFFLHFVGGKTLLSFGGRISGEFMGFGGRKVMF